jgi:rhodanese-related sulfurtransferase
MEAGISVAELRQRLQDSAPPLIVDVRRKAAFLAADAWIAGALRCDPEQVGDWSSKLPTAARVVVYCVHGHEVSQGAARALRERGFEARYLEHGFEGWREGGGAVMDKPVGGPTCWVTRERPKIDRIACPWLVARFIDPDARFLYTAPHEVAAIAEQERAQPYDVPGAALGHAGESCSFDAFIARFHLGMDPALGKLADIVRGADTDRLDLAPQCAGLLAISLGLSHLYSDDHALLRQAMPVYDALYRWCQDALMAVETGQPRKAPTATESAR